MSNLSHTTHEWWYVYGERFYRLVPFIYIPLPLPLQLVLNASLPRWLLIDDLIAVLALVDVVVCLAL